MTRHVPVADPKPVRSFLRSQATGRLIVGLIMAVLVVSLLTVFGDARELLHVLSEFDWRYAAVALGLTLWNYALRFLKWRYYTRLVNVPSLSMTESALVFLSAFSMSITPGKVGELIKATELRRLTGTPIARTTAIITAERLTDGLAMIALALIGGVQFSYGRTLLAGASMLAIGAVIVLRDHRRLLRLVQRFSSIAFVDRIAAHLDHFFSASRAVLGPKPLIVATSIGVVAWLGECVALLMILTGLGLDPSWHLLLVAIFVLAVSSLAGALSMLPGGLGVADASVAAMLVLLIDDARMTDAVAAAATLLIRFGTLWFAVLLGMIALAILRRRPAAVATH